MRIYLAGRYSRRLELCRYRGQLRERGYKVDAVWLNGEHQISDAGEPIGEHGEKLVEAMSEAGRENFYANADERAAALRRKFAHDDYRDVLSCDMLIAFTEPPRSDKGRGGRHVELGVALGLMKRVWIIGPRENIFCWLEDVRQFDDWTDCLAALEKENGNMPESPAAGFDTEMPAHTETPLAKTLRASVQETQERRIRELEKELEATRKVAARWMASANRNANALTHTERRLREVVQEIDEMMQEIDEMMRRERAAELMEIEKGKA